MSAGRTPMNAAQHRHAWAVVDFGIVDGRPMVRQRCSCGTERQVPAFDRTWDPPRAVGFAIERPDGDAPEGDAATRRSSQ